MTQPTKFYQVAQITIKWSLDQVLANLAFL